MVIKGLLDEDFTNYKKPSMYIAFPTCTFKCREESGCTCLNENIIFSPQIHITTEEVVNRYLSNPITKAFVFAGLEPFDSVDDLVALIHSIRKRTVDDIVIYTGYTKEEVKKILGDDLAKITKYAGNIIVKYGRYIPNRPSRFDEELGVTLISDNQFAENIKLLLV